MATAKNRAIDRLRRARRSHERKHEELGARPRGAAGARRPDFVDALDEARDDDIGDDLLRLIFTACHPVLSTEARVALTLRLLGGLTTDEIARAFLVPEPTIAQRIVRAKRTLAEAQRAVRGAARRPSCAERLASVLEVDLPRSSTRATRRPPATTGCGRRCATRRCASAASSPSSRPTSPRCTAWSR